ncbi:MAG: sodium-translocating pyrophosphatase [Planctomycetes bacterium]|nr:sodium-translocating pyrophosphatase [Planctomycetota bacterium]
MSHGVGTTNPNELAGFEWSNLWIFWLLTAPLGSAIALIFTYVFFKQMKKCDPGNDRMQKIARAVREGAFAYLRQQYSVVGMVFFVLLVVLSIMAFVFEIQFRWVPIAFLTGGFFSGLCGFIGMNTATLASNRTAQAAMQSLNSGLRVALRSGAVMGLVVVGFGLLDICLWFIVLNNVLMLSLHEVTVSMLAFGMGASTQALFARVGGGIYTKAADMGSDLAGKVEAGIPEDDPRNAGVIADNVGDNVGDVAGMGADLYESYCGAILATAAIGFATAKSFGATSAVDALPWVLLPMSLAGLGNIASILGIYFVKTEEKASLKTLMAALFKGINASTIMISIFSLGLICMLLGSFLTPQMKNILGQSYTEIDLGFIKCTTYCLGVFAAVLSGLIAGWIIGKATEYFTSNDFPPTQNIAKQAITSPATVIVEGIAVGMLATWISIVCVVAAIFVSFWLTGGFVDPIRGLYGISMAAVGMLSTLGITLATDAYGPIADNAGGNAQMSNLPHQVRERTDALDALGNTTAATGKGFAIGSAALTALALLAAYVEEIRGNLQSVQKVKSLEIREVSFDEASNTQITTTRKVPIEKASLSDFMAKYEVTLMNPNVISGLFIGSMMVFLFCALTLKAVGRSASGMVGKIVQELKRPGVMEGKVDPDYAGCVQIATAGAQREMILPSLIAIIVPIVTGVLFNVSGVMGLLAGALGTGFVTAIMMAASGGAWDNAKKWIEGGNLAGHPKGSIAHKAAVVGDTVGDPFKDTSGPSLNILVKLMSMVAIVFVGITLTLGDKIGSWLK